MTDKPDVDAIEARANAATPGPWLAETDSFDPDEPVIEACVTNITEKLQAHDVLFRQATELMCASENWSIAESTQEMLDARFLAAARTDVPALVGEVRRLRAVRDELVLSLQDLMRDAPRCDHERLKLLCRYCFARAAIEKAEAEP